MITGPISTVAVANAPVARSGMSSGLVNVGRMVGATLGVAILGVIFGPRIEEVAMDAPQFLASMRVTFLIGGTAQLIGAAIALTWLRHDSLRMKSQPAERRTLRRRSTESIAGSPGKAGAKSNNKTVA